MLQVLQSDWRVQYVFSLVSLHSSYVLRLLLLMQQKCGIWRVSSRVDFRTYTNWIQVLPVKERPVFLTASSAITYICIHNTGNTLYCTVGNFSGQKSSNFHNYILSWLRLKFIFFVSCQDKLELLFSHFCAKKLHTVAPLHRSFDVCLQNEFRTNSNSRSKIEHFWQWDWSKSSKIVEQFQNYLY